MHYINRQVQASVLALANVSQVQKSVNNIGEASIKHALAQKTRRLRDGVMFGVRQ